MPSAQNRSHHFSTVFTVVRKKAAVFGTDHPSFITYQMICARNHRRCSLLPKDHCPKILLDVSTQTREHIRPGRHALMSPPLRHGEKFFGKRQTEHTFTRHAPFC